MIGTNYIRKACCMLRAALFVGALLSSSAGAWAQAGYVHAVSGSAVAQKTLGSPVTARAGDTFEAGTVFQTGAAGRLVLKFADGQLVVIGPNSSVRLDRYRFDPANLKVSNLAIGLRNGTMRIVTGAIAANNREAVRIAAGESLVTITKGGGADFTLVVDTTAQELGVAAVTMGEVAVRTPYGMITKIEAGEFGPWQPGRVPPRPMPFGAMPAVVHASVAGLWVVVLPANTPVQVDTAARVAMATRLQGRAGYVEALSGTVVARQDGQAPAPMQVGDTFEAGTIFSSGESGRVVLKFADGQLVVLGPQSVLQLDRYRYDPLDAAASDVAMGLLSGAMRVVSGAIVSDNPNAARISAGDSGVPVWTAGGVDFTVTVDSAADRETRIAAVSSGQISVNAPYGPIGSITTPGGGGRPCVGSPC